MLFASSSPEDTEKLGFCLGSIAKEGYIVCLIGELGVGKTEFVKGFARGMGVEEHVTSPTFTIVNEYAGRLPLYHFDVYRLGGIDDMYDIGYEEYFFGQGVTIIEWADLVHDIIPKENITVKISKDIEQGIDFRNISIEASGDMYNDLFIEMMGKCEF